MVFSAWWDCGTLCREKTTDLPSKPQVQRPEALGLQRTLTHLVHLFLQKGRLRGELSQGHMHMKIVVLLIQGAFNQHPFVAGPVLGSENTETIGSQCLGVHRAERWGETKIRASRTSPSVSLVAEEDELGQKEGLTPEINNFKILP